MERIKELIKELQTEMKRVGLYCVDVKEDEAFLQGFMKNFKLDIDFKLDRIHEDETTTFYRYKIGKDELILTVEKDQDLKN
jgi:hypothetical protein